MEEEGNSEAIVRGVVSSKYSWCSLGGGGGRGI